MIYSHKSVSDPVHNTIGLSELEAKVVDTLVFQRLRNVAQLGLTSLVFPSAGFSRFAHSLGVCHTSGRMLHHLCPNDYLSSEEVRYARLAALLHDVGHFPFSHITERAIKNFYAGKVVLAKRGDKSIGNVKLSASAPYFDHERVGQAIVEHDPELAKIWSEFSVDVEVLVAAMKGNSSIFENFTTSDLDADRIDYLLRTSHHSGLPYGTVDIEYLLTQLRVVAGRVCVTRKAVAAVDHFLLARYFNYEQIAYNKSVSAFEHVLYRLVIELLESGRVDFSPDWILDNIHAGTWRERDDAWLMTMIRDLDSSVDGSRADNVHRHARAIIDRRPPKLVGDYMRIVAIDPHREMDFADKLEIVRNSREKIAVSAGIDPGRLLVWDRNVKVTRVGARVSVEELIEDDGHEDLAGQLVPVVMANGSTKPIVALPGSLMSVLSDYMLEGIRLFALMDDDEEQTLLPKLQKVALSEARFLSHE